MPWPAHPFFCHLCAVEGGGRRGDTRGGWCWSNGDVGACLRSCRLCARVMSSCSFCSNSVCPGEGRGEKECDDTRLRIRLSRWLIRVLVGSGDKLSSWVPEFDRERTFGDSTDGDRDISCCSASDCCEVEVERIKPACFLLSIEILFELRWLPSSGAAISSLTGAGFSSDP